MARLEKDALWFILNRANRARVGGRSPDSVTSGSGHSQAHPAHGSRISISQQDRKPKRSQTFSVSEARELLWQDR